MHCLETLHVLNAAAVRRAKLASEDETSRHCSYAGDSQTGLVLHSAKQRSTVFLKGAQAKRFLAKWLSTNSEIARDHIVESHF